MAYPHKTLNVKRQEAGTNRQKEEGMRQDAGGSAKFENSIFTFLSVD
jgi:hypothetical protein